MRKQDISSVGIVELDYHVECLYSLCTLFEGSGIRLNIFTKKNIYKELIPVFKKADFNWFVWDPSTYKINRFLQESLPAMNNSDVLLFSTLESNFKEFNELSPHAFKILRIHNANTYLAPFRNLTLEFSSRYIVKGISYILRDELIFRRSAEVRKAVLNSDMLMFPDESITNYVKQHFDLSAFPPVTRSLPMSVPGTNSATRELESDEALNIVVPGSIDKRRRNYDELIEALGLINDRLQKRIVLQLLGPDRGSYSGRVRARLSKLENPMLKFEFSGGRVPQEEFVEKMRKAHVLLNPAKVNTSYKIFREVYGRTKISGAITDVIRYQKPLIINRDYKVPENMRSCVDKYRSPRELSELILKYVDSDYLLLKNRAVENLIGNLMQKDILSRFLESVIQEMNKKHQQ